MELFGLLRELALVPLTIFVVGTTTGCSVKVQAVYSVLSAALNFSGSARLGGQLDLSA